MSIYTTGSLELRSSQGDHLFLTASRDAVGPKIGIGTPDVPTVAFAIKDSLSQTDDANKTRIVVANTATNGEAHLHLGQTSTNRGFVMFQAGTGNNKMRLGTRTSAGSNLNTLVLQDGSVGIGGIPLIAAGGDKVDLHVKGAYKSVLVGLNDSSPAEKSTIFIGNVQSKIEREVGAGDLAIVTDKDLHLQSTGSFKIDAGGVSSILIADSGGGGQVGTPGHIFVGGSLYDNNTSSGGNQHISMFPGGGGGENAFVQTRFIQVAAARAGLHVTGSVQFKGDLSFTNTTNNNIATDPVAGTNVAGKSLTISAGQSTGTGVGGSMEFKVATRASTGGTSVNALETAMTFEDLGSGFPPVAKIKGQAQLERTVVIGSSDNNAFLTSQGTQDLRLRSQSDILLLPDLDAGSGINGNTVKINKPKAGEAEGDGTEVEFKVYPGANEGPKVTVGALNGGSGQLTVRGNHASASPEIQLYSAVDAASVEGRLQFYKSRGTGNTAPGDRISVIQSTSNNSAEQLIHYSEIVTNIGGALDDDEFGKFEIRLATSGLSNYERAAGLQMTGSAGDFTIDVKLGHGADASTSAAGIITGSGDSAIMGRWSGNSSFAMFGHQTPSQEHTGDGTDYHAYGILHSNVGKLYLNHKTGQSIVFRGQNSDTREMQFDGGTGNVVIKGQAITIGKGSAEDVKIMFDGAGHNWHVGVDDSLDTLTLGRGTSVDSNNAISIDSTENVTMGMDGGKVFIKGGSYTGNQVFADAAHSVQNRIVNKKTNVDQGTGTYDYNLNVYSLLSLQGAGQVRNILSTTSTLDTFWTMDNGSLASVFSPGETWEYRVGGISTTITFNGVLKQGCDTGHSISGFSTSRWALETNNGIEAGTYRYEVYIAGSGTFESDDLVVIEKSENGGSSWTTIRSLTHRNNTGTNAFPATGNADDIHQISNTTATTRPELGDFAKSGLVTFTETDATKNIFRFRRVNGANTEFTHFAKFSMVQVDNQSRYPNLDFILPVSGPDYDERNFLRVFDIRSTLSIGGMQALNGQVTVNAFTGCHAGKLTGLAKQYDLVKIISCISTSGEPVYEVEKTSTAQDSSALGVYWSASTLINEDVNCTIAAVGNGRIKVCDQNGNINIGDWLCSSDVSGAAMRQTDSQFMNYTAAKSTENVDWDSEPGTPGLKTKIISCTYSAG